MEHPHMNRQISVDQIRDLVARPGQVLVSNTAKTDYRILPDEEWEANRAPGQWEVTCTETALTNGRWLTDPRDPLPPVAESAHPAFAAVIESCHAGLTLLVGQDVQKLELAVVGEIRKTYGDRLNAEEGPEFLVEHPYPDPSDSATAAGWLTALRDLVLDPCVTYFGETEICWVDLIRRRLSSPPADQAQPLGPN
jgi:hypothetical protein